jgi:hypothetical protein
MKCPACGATVEDGADLCLECGEPMGDSPAAAVARQENVIRPPPATFSPPPQPATVKAKIISAKKPARAEEPEPIRCPGCGGKSLAVRCPGCGTRLRPDDED